MKTVLLIDDDEIEQKLLHAFLMRRYGDDFELTYVDTLKAGIEHLQSKAYDAIFIDRILPPYVGAQESYPVLAPHVGAGQIIYISSDTSAYKTRAAAHESPVRFVDKLDMRDQIMAGLLDRP